MHLSYSEVWQEMREVRRQRLLGVLQRLDKGEKWGAIHAKDESLERRWSILPSDMWSKEYQNTRFSPKTEYVWISFNLGFSSQTDLTLPLKEDYLEKGIYFMDKTRCASFIKQTREQRFSKLQFVPLTAAGRPDGTVLFSYSGGTSEGMLVFGDGKLKEITKRPFGTTLNLCIPLTEGDIEDYRKVYERARGHEPDGEFDPEGKHSASGGGGVGAFYDRCIKHQIVGYLRKIRNTRRLLIVWQASMGPASEPTKPIAVKK